jgi:hypothetical protein
VVPERNDESPTGPLPLVRGRHDTRSETDLRESSMSDSDPDRTMIEQGELRVITTVKGLTIGATVYVDKEKKGTTPLSVLVAAGRHVIRVERSGHKAIDREIIVTSNQVTLLRLELDKPGAAAG